MASRSTLNLRLSPGQALVFVVLMIENQREREGVAAYIPIFCEPCHSSGQFKPKTLEYQAQIEYNMELQDTLLVLNSVNWLEDLL